MFGKTISQIEEESALKDTIKSLKEELCEADYILKGGDCLIRVVMNIERYGGRSLPWYLDLTNDFSYDTEGCPKPQDYEIGYYGKDQQPGTRKFIEARVLWAKKEIIKQLQEATTALEQLAKVKVF